MRERILSCSAEKPVDTNASPSAYGWCFQVGAGITLMLDNIKEFKSLKMEGASDDIKISLDSGKIYAQAKSVIKIGDQSSASTKLKDALRALSHDTKNGDVVSLIYITNIANPLSSKIASAFQYDRTYEFSVLPDDAQKKIRDLVTGKGSNGSCHSPALQALNMLICQALFVGNIAAAIDRDTHDREALLNLVPKKIKYIRAQFPKSETIRSVSECSYQDDIITARGRST